MVCGTASNAGKSHVVTGLCRLLSRRGVKVAPFKAQNMALNSYVTPAGHEIGRAQGIQALAAGVEPDVAMNPILLKPTGERTSQVVVNGRPIGHLSAMEYHDRKPALFETVLASLADLRGWSEGVGELRGALTSLLASHGLDPSPSDANFVLCRRAPRLRERLLPHGVVVRDCASFGLVDHARVAVPDETGLALLAGALDRSAP